jgi:hypothetical protein
MKKFDVLVKVLFALFFIPAVGVHIYGLVKPLPGSTESMPSHLVHIISYSAAFYAFLKAMNYRLLIYSVASVYPFLYHANCFFGHLINEHRFTPVCLLVIVMLPLGAAWIWSRR